MVSNEKNMRSLCVILLLTLSLVRSESAELRVHRIDKLGDHSKASPRFDHTAARAEAKKVFTELAAQQHWNFSQASDSRIFTAEGLKDIDVIVFDNNSGGLFSKAEKAAFEGWVRRGGGVVGIHGATHAHKSVSKHNEAAWPFWYGLWGVLHKTGPKEGPQGRRGYADWIVMKNDALDTSGALSPRWQLDKVEWYFWNYHPDYKSVKVIATAEVNRNQPLLPVEYPVTWCHEYQGGRVWYTNMGHYAENYRQREFVQHLLNGIQWVADKKD